MEQGNETILFVDDEDYLAEVGKEMLEDYGYKVDIETSPAKALALFEKEPDRYDLLITDYTMPGMTGDQLVEKLLTIRPGLPVILCSGIRLAQDLENTKGISRILMKPFDMDQLIDIVREVLDTHAS
ncbi:MAG: response regulator [Desulfobacterales bacterium]|nr:response regulator [Desulfobacterales bacterium]